ncbi:MAG: efflux RND transporter periplasmic adaptor subunit [Rhizomicrobium sp.]|nr:efflux RND transporter periplasmic adaptor subunit [Rhizomicrobium sp.]
MQRVLFAFALALAVCASAFAQSGLSWKLLDAKVPANAATAIRLQLVDGSGAPQTVSGLSVRVDMSPDAMAAMTAPATVHAEAGVVLVETKLYAPGRWAVIISGKAKGKAVKATLVVTATLKSTAPVAAGPRRILYYRNPMGLADTSPVPRKDAMGMAYIPVYSDEVTKVKGAVRLSTEKMQRAGVRTSLVTRLSVAKSVRATGTVAADENRQAVLSARFTGFVEKLYVSQTGDVVRAGQPLMRVWAESSEVLVKEADYIGSLQSGAPEHAAMAASLLRQYGITQADLTMMAKTGVPTRSITISAPASGTVMEKNAVLGMHFATGDILFKTTDVSQLWVLAEVSERDLSGVRVGQKASISFRDNPAASFDGKVLTIYPQIDPATRTVKVRIAVANKEGRLRIGQYAEVRIETAASAATLAIPASAVVDDGSKQVAFIALADGLFEPRVLKLGARMGDMVEVQSGLTEGDRIVTTGNFLLDAESNLQSALKTFGSK